MSYKKHWYSVSRGISSQAVHISHTKIAASADEETNSFIKNSVLIIIATVTLAVVGFLIFNLIATPEYLVKREVESITADYYENYFYPTILKNNSISDSVDSNPAESATALAPALDRYQKSGFARVTLRQLLLYDDRKHMGSASSLAEYCDLDHTMIKIYPESPYSRQNYRVDYTYSCKF